MATGRVLSIQSHVVSGYVGNKAAVFPLQLLGYDVDAINSVQFSNHTGYGAWTGQRLDGTQLWDLVDGLQKNNLIQYSHLLTGYIGSPSFLEVVLRVVKLLREANPNLLFVCDPVLGDQGKLYVPPELVPIYRDQVVPLANVLTPNQFEAELLTGITIKTEDDAFAAIDALHARGVRTVVITSSDIGGDTSHSITVLGSQMSESTSKPQRLRVHVPRLPMNFTGSGDLFSALLLAWTNKYPTDLKTALGKVVATMRGVLHRTHDHFTQVSPSMESDKTTARLRELRLVDSKRDIEDPPTSDIVVDSF
eukprot:Opistho-2@71781